MKIATFNVNGVNGRLEVLLRWLAETAPDIACLQELKAPQERFPAEQIEALGYKALWLGEKSWNGVAILSRVGAPVEIMRALGGDPLDRQSRYLEAAVSGMIVAALYLPNGNPRPGPRFDYKMQWMDRLLVRGRELIDAKVPAILIGDFNVIPTERDVYNPQRWLDDALFAPEARAAFSRLVDQGWTDALRHSHPDEQVYTFWKYFRNAFARDAGLRIDHILLSPQLAPRLVAAGVDRDARGWEKSSDHAPVWARLAD